MVRKTRDNGDGLSFDYMFEGALCDRYKTLAIKVASEIPELDYIEEDDFDIIIGKMAAPSGAGGKTIAEMNYVTHWLRQFVEYGLQRPLPPYLMIMYPIMFKLPYRDKIKVLIHEMFHIKPNKRGCRPHTGFGDEVIARLYNENQKRLDKVGMRKD